MKLRKRTLAVVLAGVVTAPFATQSSADALAQSILEITNLTFTGSVDGLLDVSDFDSLQFTDNGTNSANFDGAFDVEGGAPVTNNLAGLDRLEACAGPDCSTGENDFTKLVLPNAALSSGDSLLKDSPITDTTGALGVVINPGDPVVGADATTDATVEMLGGTHFGTANSTLTLTSTFSFSLANDQTITFDFDAELWLRAYLSADLASPLNADATSAWSIAISQVGGGQVFSFAPGAADDNDGGDCSLNTSAQTQTAGDDETISCTGSYSATTALLLAANSYTLTINHQSVANANQTAPVPAPFTLGLIGVGLLGLGIARKKSLS